MKKRLLHIVLNVTLILALVLIMIPAAGRKAYAAGQITVTGFTAPEAGDSCIAPSLSVTVGATKMDSVSCTWKDSNGTALTASSEFEYSKTYTLSILVHNWDDDNNAYDIVASEAEYPVFGLDGMDNVNVSTSGAPAGGYYSGLVITADITFAAPATNYVESESDINFNTFYDTESTIGCYFYFHLDKPAKVTVQTKSSGYYRYEVRNCSGGSVYFNSGAIESTDTVENTYKLRAGDFYLFTYAKTSLNFKLTKENFAWGTMNISISGTKVTATYTDNSSADSEDQTDSYISEWTVGNPYVYQHEYLTGKSKKCSGTIDTSALTKTGWYDVTFTVKNDNYSGITKTYTKSYCKKPAAPGSFNLATVGTTYVTTGTLGSYLNGDHIQVQLYKNGKWTNSKVVVSGKTAKITGLKQNTAYKIRIKGMIRKSGYKDVLTSASKAISFRTATTSKPGIKSIKISGAKYIYHAAKAASGYYDANGHWTRTAAQKAYYTTSFKVTITLSKRVKGPAGLWVNGSYKKGSGKTFTFKLSANGKLKGKKTLLQIRYANNSKWGGLSPVVKKKATVK